MDVTFILLTAPPLLFVIKRDFLIDFQAQGGSFEKQN